MTAIKDLTSQLSSYFNNDSSETDSKPKQETESHSFQESSTGFPVFTRMPILLPLLFMACASQQEEIKPGDADGDEFSVYHDDCDGDNELIHPDAEELCDGIDNNCDGNIDEVENAIDTKIWFADKDGDTFGDPDTATELACSGPDNTYVLDNTDCDDTSGTVNTAQVEDFANNIDDDCDGTVDDQDLDGHSSINGDCDDNNAAAFPGQLEDFSNGIDDDCDGTIDDQDLDGISLSNGDCDDTDSAIFPGQTEDFTNGLDDDCDGTTDDQDLDGISFLNGDCDDSNRDIFPGQSEDFTNNIDDDCDGTVDDEDLDGHSIINGDCDDTNAAAFPGQTEDFTNGIDDDCDTIIDDQDLDGTSIINGDCDDQDLAIFPGQSENFTNDIDDDCDGTIDDQDLDGISIINGDCDDSNAEVFPLQTENFSNDIDDDCDGVIDDEDLDGFTINTGDCDDNNFAMNPAVIEDLTFDGKRADCQDGMETLDAFTSTFDYYGGSSDYIGLSARSLLNIGDIDADSKDDLIIGAPFANGSATRTGKIGIFLSSQGSVSRSIDDADYIQSDPTAPAFARLGNPIANAGNAKGDGTPTYLVGAQGTETTYLIHADSSLHPDIRSAAATITGIRPHSYSYGDNNGDGISDIVIGDAVAGAIYIFEGPLAGDYTKADATATISGTGSDFSGSAVLFGHDWDGDGIDDLVIAREDFNGTTGTLSGRVSILPGPLVDTDLATAATLIDIDGAQAGDGFAQTLKVLPDINNDDIDELVVGGARVQKQLRIGAVYVFDGAGLRTDGPLITANNAITTLVGNDDSTGFSLDIGDLDNNEIPDLCIGAPRNSDFIGYENAGKVDCLAGDKLKPGVHFLYAEFGQPDVQTRIYGPEKNALFGTAVLFMGINGKQGLLGSAPAYNDFSGQVFGFEFEN